MPRRLSQKQAREMPELKAQDREQEAGEDDQDENFVLVRDMRRKSMEIMDQVSSHLESFEDQVSLHIESTQAAFLDAAKAAEVSADEASSGLSLFLEAVSPSPQKATPEGARRKSSKVSIFSPSSGQADVQAASISQQLLKTEDFTGRWRIFPGQIKRGEAHLKAFGVPYLVRAAILSAKTQVNIITIDGDVWEEKILNSGVPKAFAKTSQFLLDGTRQQISNPLGGVTTTETVVHYEGQEVASITTTMHHSSKSITQTITRTLSAGGSQMHVRDEMILKSGRVLVRETDFRRLGDDDGDEGSA